MTRIICSLVVTVAAAVLLGGCGVPFQEMESKMPPLESGNGRIYCYRDGSPLGAAIQPHVSMKTKPEGKLHDVGRSIPGGYFYIDRPAGDYELHCVTEGRQTLALTLAAGETKYVRTRISMGLLIGHVTPYLEDEKAALDTLKGCRFAPDK